MITRFLKFLSKPLIVFLFLIAFGLLTKGKLPKRHEETTTGNRTFWNHFKCHSDVCPNEYEGMLSEVKDIKSMDSFFDKVFVINLERSKDRRARMEGQFKRYRIKKYEFFKAVDGRQLNQSQLREEGILGKQEEMFVDLTDGEIACYLSHAGVWKEIVDRNLSSAMICEDDAKFMPQFNVYATLAMRDMPDDWAMIHWYTHKLIPRLKVIGNVYLAANENGGAVCYSITSKVAKYLYGIAFPITRAVDGVTNWPSLEWNQDRFKSYVILPPIVWHWVSSSTIDETDQTKNTSRIKHWMN